MQNDMWKTINIIQIQIFSIILISSVLPRPADFHILGEKVVAINNRLVRICKEEKVQFIKSFRRFLYQGKPKRDLFSIRDALHLNDAGRMKIKRMSYFSL
jgi:hypothetical protein